MVNILGVFFLSRTFGSPGQPLIGRYGGNYFSFAIVGIAFTNFMALGLGGIGTRVREGQMMGTLELMLLSPNRLGVLLVSSSLWSHVVSLGTLVLYLVVGAPGRPLGHANLPMAVLSLALAIVSFNALGLLAASFVIVLKQGNPVTWLIGTASVLLSGVFYPMNVLPDWLRTIGQVLPLTQALELCGARSSTGRAGQPVGSVPRPARLAAVLLPSGCTPVTWRCASPRPMEA